METGRSDEKNRISEMTESQNKKNIVWNAVGISLNAFYPLLLMILVTRANGLEVMGGFSFAFYVASIFFTVGIYGGKIYQISDVKHEFTNSNYISHKFISSLVMLLIAFAFCLINGYSFHRILLIFIFLIYRAIESVCESYLGVMERNYRLDLTGISRALKVIIGMAGFTIINLFTLNVYLASTAFIFSFAIVLLFYDIPMTKRFEKVEIQFGKYIFDLFKRCFSVFIFTFFTLLILNITRYFVDIYLNDEMLGIYNIIVMPTAIMPLFIQFIFQPFMMELTLTLNHKEYDRFNKRVKRLFCLLFIMGIGAVILGLLIGIPVLSFIYGVELAGFRWSLALMIFAGFAGGGSVAISMLLTLMRQLNIQIILFALTFAFGVVVSIVFIRILGIYGSFIGFALTSVFQVILFVIGYRYMYKKHRIQSKI